jgi:25S rRNA (cytosine2278-C5)-methyltransferase
MDTISSILLTMNFYFVAAEALDSIEARKGSIKSVLASIPDKDRKRISAVTINALKCEP